RVRGRGAEPADDDRPQVLLWADSFSSYLDTAGARATVELLEEAGYAVRIPEQHACCGLTWLSTGQLDGERAKLTPTMNVVAPYAEAGIPIQIGRAHV